jgi:hypothetical protein
VEAEKEREDVGEKGSYGGEQKGDYVGTEQKSPDPALSSEQKSQDVLSADCK